MTAGQSLNLQSGAELNNQGGTISSAGSAQITATLGLGNQGGHISSAGIATVSAAGIDNSKGALQAQSLTLSSTDAGGHWQVLNNHGGTIAAQQQLQVDAGGISNTGGGRLVASQAGSSMLLRSHGQDITNHASGEMGGILSAGTLEVDTRGPGSEGALDNTTGYIGSGGAQRITAGLIHNNGGTLTSDADMHLHGTAAGSTPGISNAQSGRISVGGDLTMQAASDISNRSGKIVAEGDIGIQTPATLDNHEGEIIAGKNLLINGARQTSNMQGNLQAPDQAGNTNGANSGSNANTHGGGNGSGSSGTVSNEQGTLSAQGDVSIAKALLNNKGGTVQSGKDMSFDLIGDYTYGVEDVLKFDGALYLNSPGTITNHGLLESGTITSGGNTTLQVQDTLHNHGWIKGQHVRVEANALANYGENIGNTMPKGHSDRGYIVGEKTVALDIKNAFTNRGGVDGKEASAVRTQLLDNIGAGFVIGTKLYIEANTVNNRAEDTPANPADTGIGARRELHIKAQTLNNEQGRQILSQGGKLMLDVQGTIDNKGSITGPNVHVKAADLHQHADARIVSEDTTAVDVRNQLYNYGLINGFNTGVRASKLLNIGTGRMFGDQLSIAAKELYNLGDHTVENGKTGVLAARQRLDIGAQTINNQDKSQILSLGGLAIAGALNDQWQADPATRAKALYNHGSTIEAFGDLVIQSDNINNSNFGVLVNSQVEKEVRQKRAQYFVKNGTQWEDENLYLEVGGSLGLIKPAHPDRYGIQHSPAYIAPQPCSSIRDDSSCTPKSAVLEPRDSKRFAQFGVTPPPVALPFPNARDYGAVVYSLSGYVHWPSPEKKAQYDAAVAAFDADQQAYDAAVKELDAAIKKTNAENNSRHADHWREYSRRIHLQEITYEDEVRASTPGNIIAGGNMSLNGTLNNSDSVVQAGGYIHHAGGDLNNTGTEGVRRKVLSGQVFGVWWRHRGGWRDKQVRHESRREFFTEELENTTFALGTTVYRAYAQAPNQGIQEDIPFVDNADGLLPRPIAPIDVGGNTGNHAGGHGNNTDTDPGPPGTSGGGVGGATGSTNMGNGQAGNNAGAGTTGTGSATPSNGIMLEHANANASGLDGSRIIDPQMPGPASAFAPDAVAVNPHTATSHALDAASGLQTARLAAPRPQGGRLGAAPVVTEVAIHPNLAKPGSVVRTLHTAVQVPNSSLYVVQPNKPNAPLVETDPLFTNYQTWLSSAYMLDALGVQGDAIQKRLGDGFYEQRLINEQVRQLTGQRRLADYRNDDEQYRALMNAGVRFAQTHNLRPGIALTGEQMAQLTSNMVWLVEREAALANGKRPKVLVPQLYLARIQGSLGSEPGGSGGLISAGSVIHVDAKDHNINNRSGTIAADKAVIVEANNIGHESAGRIQSDAVQLSAKEDITLNGAQVEAGSTLLAQAGGDIAVASGHSSRQVEQGYHRQKSSFWGSSVNTSTSSRYGEQALASQIGGQTISAQAGQDMVVTGSRILGEHDVALQAGRDLKLIAEQEQHRNQSHQYNKTSGIFSGGGAGFTIGQRSLQTDAQSSGSSSAASLVASNQGDVKLQAEAAYQQTGSSVMAAGGDIDVTAGHIRIDEARNSHSSQQEQRFKQSGLSISVNSPLIEGITGAIQAGQAAQDTDNTRMKALGTALAAWHAAGTPANLAQTLQDPTKGASIGSSKSQSTQHYSEQTGTGSGLAALGNITLHAKKIPAPSSSDQAAATEAGHAQANSAAPANGSTSGDLLVRGSGITAGGNVSLKADGQLDLQASSNTHEERNRSQSSSASIGVSLGGGGAQNGVSITVGMSKGKSEGQGEHHSPSVIIAGDKAELASGGDTNLIGASVHGKLTITSLQDRNQYSEKSSNSGFSLSICVPPICYGSVLTGSISAGLKAGKKTSHNTHYIKPIKRPDASVCADYAAWNKVCGCVACTSIWVGVDGNVHNSFMSANALYITGSLVPQPSPLLSSSCCACIAAMSCPARPGMAGCFTVASCGRLKDMACCRTMPPAGRIWPGVLSCFTSCSRKTIDCGARLRGDPPPKGGA